MICCLLHYVQSSKHGFPYYYISPLVLSRMIVDLNIDKIWLTVEVKLEKNWDCVYIIIYKGHKIIVLSFRAYMYYDVYVVRYAIQYLHCCHRQKVNNIHFFDINDFLEWKKYIILIMYFFWTLHRLYLYMYSTCKT